MNIPRQTGTKEKPPRLAVKKWSGGPFQARACL